MATTSIINIVTSAFGDVSLAQTQQITNAASPAQRQVFALTGGHDQLTVPTGATSVQLSGSTVDIKLGGIAGDTGWDIGTGVPCGPLPLGGGTYYLKGSGVGTVNLLWG